MACSASGRDEPNHILWLATQADKMASAQDCPFCSRNILHKRLHKSFYFYEIFSETVKKIFCDFSVGMELGNKKTITFAYNWLPFLC